VQSLKRSSTDQVDLLQRIFDWVTKDIRYVSVAFGGSSHQPHNVSETLTNLYGDCKDQSLLVRSLCQEAGIPASLVLVPTMGEPVNADNPCVEQFNHCIVEAVAEGKSFYLDPSAGPSKLGYISPYYAGTTALKLAGPKGMIVSLPSYRPQPDQSREDTVVRLNPNASGTVAETAYLTGQAAIFLKERMKGSQPEKMRKYLEDSYKRSGRKLLDFFMTDPTSTSNTYVTRLSYEVPRFGSMTAGGLAFELGGRAQQNRSLDALNLARSEPFWFKAADPEQVGYTVELPEGAVVKNKPEDLVIETPFFKATRKVVQKNNRLSVVEVSQMLDAKLSASEASKVYEAFRKLQDHRNYMYVVKMPAVETGIQPVAVSGAANKALKLNGISGAPPKSLAIINGKTLAVGESTTIVVDAKPVTIHCRAIGSTSATIEIEGGQEQELFLR